MTLSLVTALAPLPAGLTPLAPRQQEALRFIADYQIKNRIPIAIRVLTAALGNTSTNGTYDHLQALRRKGWLTAQRKIVLTSAAREFLWGPPCSTCGRHA